MNDYLLITLIIIITIVTFNYTLRKAINKNADQISDLTNFYNKFDNQELKKEKEIEEVDAQESPEEGES